MTTLTEKYINVVNVTPQDDTIVIADVSNIRVLTILSVIAATNTIRMRRI